MKKICAILFVASLLIVGLTNEVNAKVISKNRKLMSDVADRYTPGGPTPCYHCMADGKPHQALQNSDSEVKVNINNDGSGRWSRIFIM